MFVNTQAGAMSMAMPDVCKVPNAPAPPFIPTPFPNMAMSTMATPNQTKMMILAMPAHNLGTTTMMTSLFQELIEKMDQGQITVEEAAEDFIKQGNRILRRAMR